MTTDFNHATVQTVRHYLDRIAHILTLVSRDKSQEDLLAIKLSPDMLDTGFNFAIAIQFAARALCPPAGLSLPEIPDEYTCKTLLAFQSEVSDLIEPITSADLVEDVAHIAGDANLYQTAADYVTRFALPNMIFHLSMGYAGLRQGGMALGKADFDGLHIY